MPRSLAELDRKLLELVDRRLAQGLVRAGRWFTCETGCRDCCLGPFSINALDAWRLRRGLAKLQEQHPVRATAVSNRAERSWGRLAGEFPGDCESGRLGTDETARQEFFSRHGELPCPALDEASGRCELYEHRPMSCRTFGLPILVDSTRLPPCRHGFHGAPEQEIERCRVEPDPEGGEDALLTRIEPVADWESIIAWVLASGKASL